jgi:hypothetical protein
LKEAAVTPGSSSTAVGWIAGSGRSQSKSVSEYVNQGLKDAAPYFGLWAGAFDGTILAVIVRNIALSEL